MVLQSSVAEFGLSQRVRHASVGNRNRRRAVGRNTRGGRAGRGDVFLRGHGVNLRGGRGIESGFCELAVQLGAGADARIMGGLFLLRRADSAPPNTFVADNFADWL